MKISGCFAMSRRLLEEIRGLRAQTRMAVTYILSESISGMREKEYFLENIKKNVFLFTEILAFCPIEGKFYKIDKSFASQGERIKLLTDEEIELELQKPWFMERLEEIYNISQKINRKET